MLTGDLLFEPHARQNQFNKDDDHMAMIIELLGDDYPFDLDFKMGGKFSKHIFTPTGKLFFFPSRHKPNSEI
jgi:serine/threonine-protein kinase SRPK3